MSETELRTYIVSSDLVEARIRVVRGDDFVPHYLLYLPKMEEATKAIIEEVELRIISSVGIKAEESMDFKTIEALKGKFKELARKLILKDLPSLTEKELNVLCGLIVHDMLGLGNLEFLLSDDQLEEIVINSSSEPAWVYHKEFGWLKTNVFLDSEEQTENYASIIGRRVGRQITILNPLMDAHLITGDRVNATLFPISSRGNTITIRKFRRRPWTH